MSPLSGCCARLWWTVSSQLADFPRWVEEKTWEKTFFAQRWVLNPPRSSGRGSDWVAIRTLIGRRKVGYVDFLNGTTRSQLPRAGNVAALDG